jgi:hypothetical protein
MLIGDSRTTADMPLGLVPHGHTSVSFHGPPGHGRPLGFVGEGAAWVEDDALVLQGSVAPAERIGRLARPVSWLILAPFVVAFFVRGGSPANLGHPPLWLLLPCIGVGAATIVARIVGSRLRAHTERLPWHAVRAALPMGLSMHLVTSRGEAVLVGLGPSGPHAIQQLGESIVRRAGGQPYDPQAIRPPFLTGKRVALGVTLLFPVGLIALFTWSLLHRDLYVDNATGEPIELWIDGARVQTVAPNRDGLHPARVAVRNGRHTIGYSKIGAAAAKGEEIDFVSTVLINPDARACYWRSVTEYGDLSAPHKPVEPDGPLPIQTVYQALDVTNWFENTPEHVKADGSQWYVRIALKRNPLCTELGARRCDGARARLLSCEIAAKTTAELDACGDAAVTECEREARPAGAAPLH